MNRPHLSQILVKGATLEATKLEDRGANVQEFINSTRKQQEEVLRLKRINREQLKKVVQL